MKGLGPQKQYQIEQAAATMAIEDMPIGSRTYFKTFIAGQGQSGQWI